MNYLKALNNETITLLVILVFISVILMTLTMLCEFFGKRKLKIDLFVSCRILVITLLVVWAYIFYQISSISPINEIVLEILAYYSVIVLIFEIVLMIAHKKFLFLADFPFLFMLMPFWKYLNTTLSIVLIVIAIFYYFTKSLCVFASSFHRLKSHINYYSLKEALDGSKNGILFEDKYNVIYENIAMRDLLDKLHINRKLSAKEIWGKLKEDKNNRIVDENNILVFIDNLVYSFSMVPSSTKLQFVSFDITQEFQTTLKIKETNNELRTKQIEIVSMIDNIENIEKQNEIIKLKSKLHDILGQRLFILHQILDTIDEKNFDIVEIKKLLSSMLLEVNNEDISNVKNLQDSIVSSFDMIGFKIEFSGELPSDYKKSRAIVKIIRECATNAIRHANATKLFVKIYKNRVEISDNGKIQVQSFTEGTGVKGMRLTAQSFGGKINVENQGKFKIVLTM